MGSLPKKLRISHNFYCHRVNEENSFILVSLLQWGTLLGLVEIKIEAVVIFWHNRIKTEKSAFRRQIFCYFLHDHSV